MLIFIIKNSDGRRFVGGPSTVLSRQATILSQFGKMKCQQWVIIPTLHIIKVSFQWKNPDFLSRNPDFLLEKC